MVCSLNLYTTCPLSFENLSRTHFSRVSYTGSSSWTDLVNKRDKDRPIEISLDTTYDIPDK
jgi:hypothetical protein